MTQNLDSTAAPVESLSRAAIAGFVGSNRHQDKALASIHHRIEVVPLDRWMSCVDRALLILSHYFVDALRWVLLPCGRPPFDLCLHFDVGSSILLAFLLK